MKPPCTALGRAHVLLSPAGPAPSTRASPARPPTSESEVSARELLSESGASPRASEGVCTHTSFIEQTQYRQAICSVEMASFTPCWAHARTLACGFCRCNYLLLFFPITTYALFSFVTLLRTPHPLATILLSVLSQTKRICLEVRVMASGWGPPQLRRVRRGSSCFKRVQSVSAGSSDSCCCRRCFAGR